VRGLLLTVALYAAARPIAHLMSIPEGTTVLQMVALVPFARSMVSVRVVIAQRQRRFRTVALLTTTFVMVDFLVSAVAAYTHRDVVWVLAALPLSEFMRAIASHIVFSTRPRLIFDTKPLGEIMESGRWDHHCQELRSLDVWVIPNGESSRAIWCGRLRYRAKPVSVSEFL
jgi:O-antigen/teichoic acid export membrane protein